MITQFDIVGESDRPLPCSDKSLDLLGAVHDLNNLLTVILMSTTLALTKLSDDSPAREHLEVALGVEEQTALLAHQTLSGAKKH
jgi:hypothetical protein